MNILSSTRCPSLVLPALILSLLATVLPSTSADAQVRNRLDNRGREFRIGFLPTNGWDDVPTLMISIWAERPTRGVISYVDDPSRTFTVSISRPYQSYVFRLDTFQLLMPNPKAQPVSRRTLLLQFDDEVTVYGINTMRWSSDAFVALPNDALGRRHIILSYPNTQQPNAIGDVQGVSDFPSQFAVIATEDGTRVDVIPTVRLNAQPNTAPFAVNLDAGEVFLAQADGPTGTDVTGTEVRSNKPVVVYGSHQRTNIPYQQTVGRDHLVEQLPSVDRWQSRAMLLPHFQIPKSVDDANIARIIAADDNTVVSIDSVPLRTLRSREMVQIPLDRAKLVTATGPILVAQYHHSAVDEHRTSQPNDSIGDPFMTLVVSREQFDSVYVFENFGTKDFTIHFINVVIPTERANTLTFDGFDPAFEFHRIPKTSYSYAQLQVPSGSHVVRARVPFGLYVYGYGPYNSYGYPGGFVFDTLFKDQREPRVAVYDSCLGATGKAYDDSTYDFGMERLDLMPGSINVTMQKESPPAGSDSIHFRLSVIDPYQDGWAVLKAVDTAGLDATASFWVKGFTVAISPIQTAPVTLDTLASLNGLAFCRRIRLVNYGHFDQEIARIRINPAVASVTAGSEVPLVIPAGGSAEIEVCFTHPGDTAFAVEIAIDNGCLERPIAILPLISGTDSIPPAINVSSDPCQTDVNMVLSEPGLLNSGVKSVEYRTTVNYVPELSPALPTSQAQLRLRRLDPRQDLIYDIVVTDAVGMSRRVTDTIGGFTLAAYQAPARQVAVRINQPFENDDLTLGERVCDTIYLVNYGLLPLTLQNPRMLGNTHYSIPPEQLPITLMPGERRGIAICVTPVRVGLQLDTLVVDFACGTVNEQVEMRTVVQPFRVDARDRCGNPLSFNVGEAAKRTFLAAPAPNPAEGAVTHLTFGLSEPEEITLGVFDMQGNEVQRLLDGDAMPAGLTRIDADVALYAAGVYYVRMTTARGEVFTGKLVVSR